jgi:glycerol-3-phosphate acyltransferase PlsX
MRVAVDAMGGDNAPHAIVEGCLEAVREYPHLVEVILVGDRDAIRRELDRKGAPSDKVRIEHASQVVEMGESPALALRRKRDSSIARAVDLVREGRAAAIVSAGNTGAAVAATKIKLRTLAAVERPAIATVLPSPSGGFVLVDAGANIDCKPDHLLQFAVMGNIYARDILRRPSPRVALLSIGEEQAKGNELTREAFHMLERAPVHFVGNVEGRQLFRESLDVVVCDGFVGNVVLKTGESVAAAFQTWLRRELTANPLRALGALMSRGAYRSIARTADYAEYGGAPLLGVRGACIIAHGASSPKAIRNAVRVALEFESQHVTERIDEEVEQAYVAVRSQ